MRFILLLLPLALATGCASSIRLQVLEPSVVTSPANIRTIAVVDRSRASTTGQKVLGALESIVTGEGLGADNFGRSRAVMGAVDGLRNSPRFDGVSPYTPPKEMETNLFDRELSWDTAVEICRSASCQAILALETFDSDSTLDVTPRRETVKDNDGNETVRTVFEAQRRTTVRTTWRYYDVVNRRVLDSVRDFDAFHTFTETDPVRQRAISRLPPQGDGVGFAGELAGRNYARRIAPTFVWVSRSYYGRGDDLLKLGRRHVRANDWEGAQHKWDDLYRSATKARAKGRAAFNMAVAAEVAGDLELAAEWATEAAIVLGNGKARSYRALIDRRRAAQRRLDEQMRQEEPGVLPGQAPTRSGPLAVPQPGEPRTRSGGPAEPPPATPRTRSGRLFEPTPQ